MGVFASKPDVVAVFSVWSRGLFCVKVFLINALQGSRARIESEYATFPMGIGFGR
jgi:hypothetical protein